ncbi:MAG: hypothetical protein ABGY72_08755 [bacterium]
MDTKRLAIGTVVGGIVMFGATYLIWNIAFDYYVVAIEAAGVAREPQLLWVSALSNVPFAALVTLVIERGGSSTIGGGVKIGAMVGFLVWGGVALVHYADMTIFDLTATILDPLLASVEFGIGGGVIAAALGRR